MLRICRQCGTVYESYPASTLCPDCVRINQKNTKRPRTCCICGTTFPGGPAAKYCPDCRSKRKQAQDQANHQRANNGGARKIGSTEICAICQRPYTVNSGNQRYCPDCAEDAYKENLKQLTQKWYNEHRDPKERRELRKATTAPILCKICGTPFLPRGNAKTCSTECSKKLTQQRNARHRARR